MHDIGRTFAAGVLSKDDYLAVEDAYVAVLGTLHADAGAPPLTCKAVEQNGPASEPLPDDPTRPVMATLDEGAIVAAGSLAAIVRACLRERGWCRLESPACSMTFGYDYYAYWLGDPPSAKTLALANERGLFLEPSDALVFSG